MDQIVTSREFAKVAIVGNVDSGKSTLVGVLTKGEVDDGRGSARAKVFNYKHEQENGRTSSIAQEIMGFNANGEQVLHDRFVQCKNKYWKDVVEQSKRVVNLIDLCGHEKYLKTTIFGLVAMIPDYAMIVVGANMGVSKMTREHLGLALFLKIPFMVVMTKVDIAPPDVLKETLDTIKALVKSPMIKKACLIFDQNTPVADVDKCAQVMHGNNIVPIFQVSNVTGKGFVQLRRFLYKVENRVNINRELQNKDAPVQFDIQENFNVQGVGRVVSGVMRAGTAKVGQTLLFGPNKTKQFKPVVIKSIHVFRCLAQEATPGQLACFQIKPLKSTDKLERNDFRKGMILIDPSVKPEPFREFEANVHVLHHSTTMSQGYNAVLHCGVVRQAVAIKRLHSDKVALRMGDTELVRFRFLFTPEYVRPNQVLIIREGRTKIFGFVTSVITDKQLELEAEDK